MQEFWVEAEKKNFGENLINAELVFKYGGIG